MTLEHARIELAQVGVTIRKTDGEYRVNLKGATEATAYYTNDIDDAVQTGYQLRIDAPEAKNFGHFVIDSINLEAL